MQTVIISTVSAIIGSSAVWSFFQYMVKRHDDKHDVLKEIRKDIKELKTKVNDLDDKGLRNEALTARMRIIRFADELITGNIHHSLGHFLSILDDIDTYESNEKILKGNGHGKASCKLIRETFDSLIKSGEFKLEDEEGGAEN